MKQLRAACPLVAMITAILCLIGPVASPDALDDVRDWATIALIAGTVLAAFGVVALMDRRGPADIGERWTRPPGIHADSLLGEDRLIR
jgi:hypothetical protein